MPKPRRVLPRRRPINLSRGGFRHYAAALGVSALLAVSAHADWTMTSADFKSQQNLTVNSWSLDEGLSATVQGGKNVTIPTREILSIAAANKKAVPYPGSNAWKLSLKTGDVLYGDAVKVAGNSLMFHVEGIEGDLAIPLKRILSLGSPVYGAAAVANRNKKLPSATDHDIILFKQADNLAGIFANIDDTNVKFKATGSDDIADIPLANVDTVVFGGVRPLRGIPPLALRLTLQQGSTLTIPLTTEGKEFQWLVLGKISFKDAAGQTHALKEDALVSAEVVGGRIVYLTELDAAKEDQTTFLGTTYPSQINKNVLGQPLRIAHTTYDRGIGVHTQSSLTYELDGSFDTLSLRVGMDDSAAPNGEAIASVVLDGKVLWEAALLKPGEISPELSLPVKGGRKLELHADSAGKLDVQGRVNWVNVSLRRK